MPRPHRGVVLGWFCFLVPKPHRGVVLGVPERAQDAHGGVVLRVLDSFLASKPHWGIALEGSVVSKPHSGVALVQKGYVLSFLMPEMRRGVALGVDPDAQAAQGSCARVVLFPSAQAAQGSCFRGRLHAVRCFRGACMLFACCLHAQVAQGNCSKVILLLVAQVTQGSCFRGLGWCPSAGGVVLKVLLVS